MPLLSRVYNHLTCTCLVITQDTCNMHNKNNVVHTQKTKRPTIDVNRRIMSMSKDGTRVRAYKQCSHKGCENIAKKLGRCNRHGASCSCKVSSADKGMPALVSKATRKFTDAQKGDVSKEFVSIDYHSIYDSCDGQWEC
jgi:hypothetical protein